MIFEILAVLVYSLEHISQSYKVLVFKTPKIVAFQKAIPGTRVSLRDAVRAGPDPHEPDRVSVHHHRPRRREVPHRARSIHQDQGQSVKRQYGLLRSSLSLYHVPCHLC